MALTPIYDRKKIMTGQAALWLQPYDPDLPAALPPVTEPLGFDWSGIAEQVWEAAGATMEGVSITFSREASDIRIEEQVTVVDQKTTSGGFTVSVQLSEDSMETMRYAYGGGTLTVVPPTATDPGTKQLTIQTDVGHFALGLESQAPTRTGLATPWRRILIPDITSVTEVETSYRRAEQQRVYSCTFTSLVPFEEVVIMEEDAPISA